MARHRIANSGTTPLAPPSGYVDIFSEGDVIKTINSTGVVNEVLNVAQPTYKVVSSLADLPDPIAEVITLEDNTTYLFQGLINTGTNTINCGVSNTLFGFDKSNDGILYTGTGNAIEVSNQTVSIVNMFLLCNSGGISQIVSVNNDNTFSFQIRECIIAGNTNAGTVNGGNIVAINNNIHSATSTNGWEIRGVVNKLAFATNYFENALATHHIRLRTGTFNTAKIDTNDFTISSPNFAIDVANDVMINNNGGGYVNGNTFTGTGELLTGIDATTLEWIIEGNDRDTQSTSQLVTERKIRSEAELDLFLALPDPTIYSYRIDAREFLVTKPIVVPGSGVNGGLTFFGNGNNYTKINTLTSNINIFEGGGNLFLNDMIVACEGTGSKVFDMVSTTGFEAVEMINVNFQDCEDIGILDGFRQGLIVNGFMLNVKQGFLFRGTWSGGFRIGDSRFIFTAAGATYMFKSDVGHSFSSRFVSDANSTIGTGAIGIDFREDTFVDDGDFQLLGAQFNGGGTYVNGIDNTSRKSLWRANRGIKDTFQGVVFRNTMNTVTPIALANTYVELLVMRQVIEAVWFSSANATTLTANYDSSLELDISIELFLALQAGNNNQIEIQVRNYRDSLAGGFDVLDNFVLTSNGGALGTRVEPVSLKTFDTVNQNDQIRIFVRNNSGTTDILCETSSKLIISQR